MTRTTRQVAAGVVAVAAMLIVPRTVSGANVTTTTRVPGGHVRSHSRAILALIAQATEQSATFSSLVETIDASDGIVYVEEGACHHGVRACFHTVTTTAGYRMLWVRVDTTKNVDWNLMGTIGHELRHTIEVLHEPSVKTNADMFFLYQRIGYSATGSAVETTAAVDAGDTVRDEVREFNRRAKVR